MIVWYCLGLEFYLSGTLYPNNSIVDIADIGTGVDALHCITNRMQCCRDSASGDWYLPGQITPIEGNGENFSRSRWPSAVLIHRRNSATEPKGLYRCEIPNSDDMIRSLYIGV